MKLLCTKNNKNEYIDKINMNEWMMDVMKIMQFMHKNQSNSFESEKRKGERISSAQGQSPS